MKALKVDPQEGCSRIHWKKALVQIAVTYKTKEALKDLPAEDRPIRRRREVLPLWEAYFSSVHAQNLPCIVSEKTKEVLKYNMNQEKYLRVFLENGEIPIDNSATERAIRSFTVGRSN